MGTNLSYPPFVMPFGCRITPEGKGVCFRLYAPAADLVDLCLRPDSESKFIPLTKAAHGWYEVAVAEAKAGDLYQYRIDNKLLVPDPASRFQPYDIHGPSQVLEPDAFNWQDSGWSGRPWEEAVLYELHIGTFSSAGTFAGVEERLDYLTDLGITALELMPVADFPGQRNWGYDGALLFAPDSVYGRPDDLKHLVQTAHQKGLMVLLDVVYNHFGPEGNYLHVYAKESFFTEKIHTPWGAALNFSGPDSRIVRDFFIYNALYWLNEYHFDGLRLDAVHAIYDDSQPDILEEIAAAVNNGPGRLRNIHLVLENDNNAAHYLRRAGDGAPKQFTAQWNDDLHHACHVLLSGEVTGYYQDYQNEPIRHLGRCLTEGFAYQGETSVYRNGAKRGEQSRHLPPTAFVSFLQNHDQVGNRAFGERLTTLAPKGSLRIAAALILLAPSPPLIFMGEEFGAATPFPFFCDFGPELSAKVTEGRRREFARFPAFTAPGIRNRIPDPGAPETFQQARLNWLELAEEHGRGFYQLYSRLLALRRREIIPRLPGCEGGKADYEALSHEALMAHWRLGDGSTLQVMINFGPEPLPHTVLVRGSLLFAEPERITDTWQQQILPAQSVAWFLET